MISIFVASYVLRIGIQGAPGEVKHLSNRRKRKKMPRIFFTDEHGFIRGYLC